MDKKAIDRDIIGLFDGFTKSTKGGAVLTPEMMQRALCDLAEDMPEGSLVRENLEKAFAWAIEELFPDG